MDEWARERKRKQIADQHWSWIRMIIEQAAYGIVIGLVCVWLLLFYDINRIGTMIAHSEHRIGFVVLLVSGFSVTFGMAMAGTAIWLRAISRDDE